MGRQVGFHALPDDLGEFLEFVCAKNPVIVTLMDLDRPEIEPLADPHSETRVMTLWNRMLIPTLKRELVRRPGGSDYYRIPYSLPVLELSPSRVVSWSEQPALLSGRLYGFSFESAAKEYAAWYEGLARWIRSHFVRNPVEGLDGYIGSAALAWYRQGGILLPASRPPVTDEWESFVEAQRAGRVKSN
jgi:hypothetical protein